MGEDVAGLLDLKRNPAEVQNRASIEDCICALLLLNPVNEDKGYVQVVSNETFKL